MLIFGKSKYETTDTFTLDMIYNHIFNGISHP